MSKHIENNNYAQACHDVRNGLINIHSLIKQILQQADRIEKGFNLLKENNNANGMDKAGSSG